MKGRDREEIVKQQREDKTLCRELATKGEKGFSWWDEDVLVKSVVDNFHGEKESL